MKAIAELGVAPKEQIRNAQCGDWRFLNNGSITALSAKMNDRRSELAVAIHELIEAWLCREEGITDEQVTEFDRMFEEERLAGKHRELDEDGDDPRAPYREQHVKATLVEMVVCQVLGITWTQHENNVVQLFYADRETA